MSNSTTLPPGKPKAIIRAEAFMEERLSSGVSTSAGDLVPVKNEDLPNRSENLQAYRQLHARHNPRFPAVNGNGVGGNAEGGEDEGLLIGEDLVPDSLLPGHFYPIGPTALLNGQANTSPTVSGRITALAVAPDGQRIYCGAANGGVWRSDDSGNSWRPMMNALHLAPTSTQSDSLAIGAVAVDPNESDRIFVGTGEGPGRVQVGGSPEFFGVGPLFSPDGGFTWVEESVDEVRLAGSAFFRMLVDPVDPNKVTAASRAGVLQRMPRNRRLALDPNPQAYLFRHTPATQALSSYFWNQDGQDTTLAWTGGAGYLQDGEWLTPFSFSGIPYFHQYNRRTGDVVVNLWKGNGQPANYLTTEVDNWGTGWTDLMPVTLAGKACMVTYNSGNGRATLWLMDIRADVLFVGVEILWENRQWGPNWTNLVPVTIQGQPYFLAYNYVNGDATLQRWLPNGEYVRVFRSSWEAGQRIMAFNIDAESYLLLTDMNRGSGTLKRWNPEGRFQVVGLFPKDTFGRSINLQLVPFVVGTTQQFLGYNYDTGAVRIYKWTADMNLENVAAVNWGAGQIVKGFVMGYEWIQPTFTPKPPPSPNLPEPKTPTASGLAVARNAGATHYYAAFWDDQVYRSTDGGANWAVLGSGFPTKAGRITLASQGNNQEVLYAFTQEGLVYRWDRSDDKWRKISGVPAKDDLVKTQGGYDLSIAVSPNNIDLIYLGGAGFQNSAALYRCAVTYSRGNLFNSISMVPTWVGNSVHADIHALEFTECNPDALWVGSDGGVFRTTVATSTDAPVIADMFQPKNCGLGTQTVNFLEQHPTEDAILFCGTQDNGGQRMIGSEAWRLASFGDCGHVLIDWSTPQNVLLSYIYNKYFSSAGGGSNPGGNTSRTIPGATESNTLGYPPFAGTPVAVGVSPLSQRIAFGSNRPWLSDNFGNTDEGWRAITPAVLGSGNGFRIKSMLFLTPQRLVMGTMNGQVFQLTENTGVNPATWDLLRLDNIPPALGVSGPITGMTADPADDTQTKFYVAVGGTISNFRRVWYFDGNGWEARSGPSKGDVNALLDIQYNTLASARIEGEDHLFAGADIGIWHSQDNGQHWRPFSVGLPESAVFDLKIFPEDTVLKRPWLLRAATYGRSVFERVLAGGNAALKQSLLKPVQLYIQTNIFDRGLYPAVTHTVDGYATNNRETDFRMSVDMKMKKSEDGAFVSPADIDFCQFDTVDDDRFKPIPTIRIRYYFRVHTRGLALANGVTVNFLLAKVQDDDRPINNAGPPPALPVGVPQRIQQNQPIPGGTLWRTVGSATVNNLFAGTPLVTTLEFDLAENGSYFVLAILNHPSDLFDDNQTDPLILTSTNRKVAMSYFIMGT